MRKNTSLNTLKLSHRTRGQRRFVHALRHARWALAIAQNKWQKLNSNLKKNKEQR